MLANLGSSGFLRRRREDDLDMLSSDDSSELNTAIDTEFNAMREVDIPINEQSAAERVIQSGKRTITVGEPLFLPDDQDSSEGKVVAMSQINSSIMYSQDKRNGQGNGLVASQFDDQSGKISVTQFKLNRNNKDSPSSPAKSTQSPKPKLRNNIIISEDEDDIDEQDYMSPNQGFDKSPPNNVQKPIKHVTLTPLKSKQLLKDKVRFSDKYKSPAKESESFTLDASDLLKQSKSVFEDEDHRFEKRQLEREQSRRAQALEALKKVQEKRKETDRRVMFEHRKHEEKLRAQQLQQKKIFNRLKEKEEQRLKKLELLKKPSEQERKSEDLALQNKLIFEENRRKEREQFQKSLAKQSKQVLLSAATVRLSPVKHSAKVNVPVVQIVDMKGSDLEEPNLETPEVEEPNLETPEVEEPNLETPDVEEPNIVEPEVEKPEVEKDTVVQPEVISLAELQMALDSSSRPKKNKKKRIPKKTPVTISKSRPVVVTSKEVLPIPNIPQPVIQHQAVLSQLKSELETLQSKKQQIRSVMNDLMQNLSTLDAEEQSKIEEIFQLLTQPTNTPILDVQPQPQPQKKKRKTNKKSKYIIDRANMMDTQQVVDEHMDAINALVLDRGSSSLSENESDQGVEDDEEEDTSYSNDQPRTSPLKTTVNLRRKIRPPKDNEVVILSDNSD